MIAPLENENATIEQALVFYQQHLLSEQGRIQLHPSKNGKERDQDYDQQIRTVAAIIEKRKVARNEASSDRSSRTGLQYPRHREAESTVDPFADQYMVSENVNVPGGVAEQISQLGLHSMASVPQGLPDQIGSVAQAELKSPGGSSVKRKPVNRFPSLGHFPSTPQSTVSLGSKASFDTNMTTPSTPPSGNTSTYGIVPPSLTQAPFNSSPSVVAGAINKTKPISGSQEHFSVNNMEMPPTGASGPTRTINEEKEYARASHLNQKLSWQDATWTNVMSNAPNNAPTNVSINSQRNFSSSNDLFPPELPAKIPITAQSYATGSTQDLSNVYAPVRDIAVPPYGRVKQHADPRSPPERVQEAAKQETKYRQPSTFNVGKFGSFPKSQPHTVAHTSEDLKPPSNVTQQANPFTSQRNSRTPDLMGSSTNPSYGEEPSSSIPFLQSFPNTPPQLGQTVDYARGFDYHPQKPSTGAEIYTPPQNYMEAQVNHQNGNTRTFLPSQVRLPSWSSLQSTSQSTQAQDEFPREQTKQFSTQMKPGTFSTFGLQSRTGFPFRTGPSEFRQGSESPEDFVPNRLQPIITSRHRQPPSRHRNNLPETFNSPRTVDQNRVHHDSPPNNNDIRFPPRIDQEDREKLQRMQDSFNREENRQLEEQEAFARRVQDEWNSFPTNDPQWHGERDFGRYGYGESPQSQPPGGWSKVGWTQVQHAPNDSIKFAPSLDRDITGPTPPLVVKTPRTGSIKPSQAPAQRNFDAAKAAAEEIRKFEEKEREREQREKQARIEKAEAARAALRPQRGQIVCTVCHDPPDGDGVVELPCDHPYHGACLANAFRNSLYSGKVFICCNRTPVPVDLAAPFLPDSFVTTYRAKMVERSTPNPIYCPQPNCSAFIPPANYKGDMAICLKCGFVSCRFCKNPEHKGTCPPDKNGAKLLNLANDSHWTQCKRCNAIVERDEGCLHMTCTCGHEFCYNCGTDWGKCKGRCPRRK